MTLLPDPAPKCGPTRHREKAVAKIFRKAARKKLPPGRPETPTLVSKAQRRQRIAKTETKKPG